MMEYLITAATLLIGLLLVMYIYLTHHFDHWRKRGIPGPKPSPLFGTFPSTITGKRSFMYDMDEIYRDFKQQARFVGVFMTRNPQLMILDPALVKDVLITNFKCFQDNESSKWMNKMVEPIAGGNPFVLTGNIWKVKRAEMVAGLTMSKVKGMYPVIEQTCKKLTKYLKSKAQNVLEAKDLALKFTGEVVADVVWGIEAGTFVDTDKLNEDCTFVRMSKRMIAQAFKAVFAYFITEVFPIVRRLFTVRVYPEETDQFFLDLTRMAIQMRAKQAGDRQDFLQYLIDLQQKKGLNDTGVVALALTFHFDGFETSAALISHCLLMLGRHQKVQDFLRREIQSNLKDNGGNVPFDELMKLPYLDQCINETLRIFTPLAFMSKICTEPCELTNNDGVRLTVNVGDICLISAYSLHHDEDYYSQPDSFMPERFAEENGGTKKYKDMGVYLPFGDGPRICLGMKFGLAQAKAAVVEVIKNFKVTVNERTRTDNCQDSTGFIMNLKGGIYLDLEVI